MPLENNFSDLSDTNFGSVTNVGNISGLSFGTDISGIQPGEGVFPVHILNLYKVLSGQSSGVEVGVDGLVAAQEVTVNDTLTAFDVEVKNRFDMDSSATFGSGVVSEISGTINDSAGDISSTVIGPNDTEIELTINDGAVDSSEIAFSAVGTRELADKAGRRIEANENAWTTAELQIDRGIEPLEYIRGHYELFNDTDKISSFSPQDVKFDGTFNPPIEGFDSFLGSVPLNLGITNNLVESAFYWWGSQEDPKRIYAVGRSSADTDDIVVAYADIDFSSGTPTIVDNKRKQVPNTLSDSVIGDVVDDQKPGSNLFAFTTRKVDNLNNTADVRLYVYDGDLDILGSNLIDNNQFLTSANRSDISMWDGDVARHRREDPGGDNAIGVVDFYDTGASKIDEFEYQPVGNDEVTQVGPIDFKNSKVVLSHVEDTGGNIRVFNRSGNEDLGRRIQSFSNQPVTEIAFSFDNEYVAYYNSASSFEVVDSNANTVFTDSDGNPASVSWNSQEPFLAYHVEDAGFQDDDTTNVVNTENFSTASSFINPAGPSVFDDSGKFLLSVLRDAGNIEIRSASVFDNPITATSTDIDLSDDGFNDPPGSIVISDDFDADPNAGKNIINYEVSDKSGNTVSVPEPSLNEVVFTPSLQDRTLNVTVSLETDSFQTELNSYAVNFKPEY